MTIRKRSRLAWMSTGAGPLGIATILALGVWGPVSPAAAQDEDAREQRREERQERRERRERDRRAEMRDREEGATGGRVQQRGMEPAEAVDVLTAISTGEIELARFAREHASSPRVRALAEELIRDHTQAQARVDEFARTESITPNAGDVSRRLRSEARDTHDRLESLTGESFDRQYVDSQITMHREALDLIDQQMLPGAQEGSFRELARSLRTTLSQHLDRAMELRGEVAGAVEQQQGQQQTPEREEE